MNPYGVCGHTKYEGGPACVHDAYSYGFDEGLKKSLSVIDRYVHDNFKHVVNEIGLCAPFSGDRCDIQAALLDLRKKLTAARDSLITVYGYGSTAHDPLCPSHYTFTACECALINEVRLDESAKSVTDGTKTDTGGN